MKKRLCALFFIVLLLAGCSCTTVEKRKQYEDYEKIPYIPTITAPSPEYLIAEKCILVFTVIGIPYVVADTVVSVGADIILLPYDVYRNHVIAPKRKKIDDYRYLKYKKYYLIDEKYKKLEEAKTEEEKQKIREEYRIKIDECKKRLKELEAEIEK